MSTPYTLRHTRSTPNYERYATRTNDGGEFVLYLPTRVAWSKPEYIDIYAYKNEPSRPVSLSPEQPVDQAFSHLNDGPSQHDSDHTPKRPVKTEAQRKYDALKAANKRKRRRAASARSSK